MTIHQQVGRGLNSLPPGIMPTTSIDSGDLHN